MQKHLPSLSLPLSMLAVCGLVIAACTPTQPETKITNNYQAPAVSIAPPANVKAICYEDADLNSFRVRQVQQQLVVGVLSCKGADGKMLFEKDYGAFVTKYTPELSSNAAEMKSVARRKKGNLDVIVTEIANRTAQQPSTDAAFCSRHQRALAWALLPQVTTLKEVPSPYDFGPEMKVFPCPKS
ncbi:hypothetical protein BH11PSE3_BH11PSE3_48090 [soil metagenome]